MQNNTIFGHYLSRYIIVLNKTTSTNDYLKNLMTNFKPLPQLTAIMAKTQTQGRGQRGSLWIAEPGQNLTVSVYLELHKLDISKHFFLTVISSLALHDTIRHYVNKNISIKWPNDIFIDKKKICGLLIESKVSGYNLTSAIIGIGLNVYQTMFPEDIQHKTTSFRQNGLQGKLSFTEIIQTIQRHLHHYHTLLLQDRHSELLKQYNDKLFQKDETATYLAGNRRFTGKIVSVDKDGLLHMMVNGQCTKFDLKEIAYQL